MKYDRDPPIGTLRGVSMNNKTQYINMGRGVYEYFLTFGGESTKYSSKNGGGPGKNFPSPPPIINERSPFGIILIFLLAGYPK